ncbi:nuclear transport factor 2 family protein [Wenzhouxiangella sp. EGI_FJ10409]|uniref:nuclear transport factor 2 family protein n=1 Tax=Wenzhouxiangella sp. EGI_FJ10409 TaxID=3243767 RepID=UPI0035E2B77B
MNGRAKFVIALLALVLASSAWAQSPDEVVERYMAAYNDHDVDAMLELVDPDIQWLSVDGDRISVETDGAEALAEAMRGYFEAVPSTRSSIESMMVSGQRVSVRERAHWESSGQPRSQAALAVYEIAEGRIVRVWYFSAE